MSTTEVPTYTPEEEKYVIRNKEGVPVGVKPHNKWTPAKIALWVAISFLVLRAGQCSQLFVEKR